MPVTVIAFGPIADITGVSALVMDDTADTDTLRALLTERYPGLKHLTFAVAVDRKTIAVNTPLGPASVVALLPPFSGG